MALRNAFEGLALDSTLRRLLTQLHFARDSFDRLRVVVDSGSVTLGASTSNVGRTSTMWAAEGGYSAYYSVGAPSSMDAREEMKAAIKPAVNIARQRWTFT